MGKPRLFTVADVAKVFGVNESRIRALVTQGRVEGAIKPGSEWLIPEGSELLPGAKSLAVGPIGEYIAECQANGVPATIPPRWSGSGGEIRSLNDLLQRRRKRRGDERTTRLATKIGQDPVAAAVRMRELEIGLALAAGSLEGHGDRAEAELARGILEDEGGDWGTGAT